MDSDELEGTCGSDIEDLINIECDMDDEDIGDIDAALLLSDEELHTVAETKKDEPKQSGARENVITPSKSEERKTPIPVDEKKHEPKSDTKGDDKKKNDPKVDDNKKHDLNVDKKKRDLKTDNGKKPESKVDKQKPSELKTADKKNTGPKVDDKNKPSPEVSSDKKSTTDVSKAAIIDDVGADVSDVETIEADVEDFPEEWMVIDEMEEESYSNRDSNRSKTDRSRREYDSRYSSRSRNSDYSRNSRHRSRRRSRSRSRSRGRPRNGGDNRRSNTSEKDKNKSSDSQKLGNSKDKIKTSTSSYDKTLEKGKSKDNVKTPNSNRDTKLPDSATKMDNKTKMNVKDNMADTSGKNTKSISDVSKGTSDVSKKNTNVSKRTSDVSKNTTDVSKKTPDVSKKTPDVSKKTPDVSKKTPDVSKRTSDASKRTSDASKKTSDMSKKTDASKKTDVSKKTDASKKTDVSKKTSDAAKKTSDVSKRTPEVTKKTPEETKRSEPAKPFDPFKNMRDTIERFDKNWRWNLKISPIEVGDLKNDVFRKIISSANDSVVVFNMQNDIKRKYGFLDLCLSSAGEIRHVMDNLCQLKMETNFIHVSVSHKLFGDAGTESALLKLDLREGKNITSHPLKGTEKQRTINISNGPKGMSKIMLDAIFAKIANFEITENNQNKTSSAVLLCANPESVGGLLSFYQSVVIGGRRLQLRSEVTPPQSSKDSSMVKLKPNLEERRSPAAANNKSKTANNNQNNKNTSRHDDRNKRQPDRRQQDNRRRADSNKRSEPMGSDGLLGPIPGSGGGHSAVFSTPMGGGRGFENMNIEQRHQSILVREEAERRQESTHRIGLTVGVDNFMDRPGIMDTPDLIRQETERLQRELNNSQQMYDNNFRQDFRMQEEMRLHREAEMRHQAELLDHKRHQEELMIRIQQEREQQLQEQKLLEQERLERDRLELQRKEQERIERECQERERLENERKEIEEMERKERLAREQLDRDRKERERQDEIKRQEVRRKERDNKVQQEQQQRERYLDINRRQDVHRPTGNSWQHNLQLQNQQEQFEQGWEIFPKGDSEIKDELGIGSRQNKSTRFDPPPKEENTNLHQKIREQWEKQVSEASRLGQPISDQHDMRMGDNNGNAPNMAWNRNEDNQPDYDGNWDISNKSDTGYGNWSTGQEVGGAGLLGAAPPPSNQTQSSTYGTAIREYGHQSIKRGNPWGEETPNYTEKRSRNEEEIYGQQQSRDTSFLSYRPINDQWNESETREPEMNYNQAGWGTESETDPYRNRPGQQYSNW